MMNRTAIVFAFFCSLAACVDHAAPTPWHEDHSVVDGWVMPPQSGDPAPCAGCKYVHTSDAAIDQLEVRDRDGTELCKVIVDHTGRVIVDTCGLLDGDPR
jgi:hypothetical protein